MKKLWIFSFFLIPLLGCNHEKGLIGNYFSTNMSGEYTEYYFIRDSLRIATENNWVNLSDWKKIELKDDTLYFETFGEWREQMKAEVNRISNNKVRIILLKSNDTIYLQKLYQNIDFENIDEFWKEFEKRKNSLTSKPKFLSH